MEASALTHASQRGLLARRSPLLKLQGDGRLIAMARSGNAGAFETIVDRYQGRLLGFCRQMLGSTEDAEDVLQEVFVNAYRAMLGDEREINLRPWLYRIARNRCLNHLRKPTADAQESMDMVPMAEAASTAEKVHNREEFRQLLSDVGKLPETQRSALLLREMDAMSYEEIAQAMDTSVPSIKSLLVRARISLAEASQARQLTCGEVRLELAEAAEGLRKVSGPVRRHVRECKECTAFRAQVRSNDKVLAALFPTGTLIALKGFIASKLGLSGGGAGAAGVGGATAGAGATVTGAGAMGSVGAALSSGGAAGGLGAVSGALGAKAVAGVVTAAVLTAGAVEVNQYASTTSPAVNHNNAVARVAGSQRVSVAPAQDLHAALASQAPQTPVQPPAPEVAPTSSDAPPATPAPEPVSGDSTEPATTTEVEAPAAAKPAVAAITGATPQHTAPTGSEVVVVTVSGGPSQPAPTPPATSPPVESSSPPPAETAPPAESSPTPPPSSGTETAPEAESAPVSE